jgi:hypothetical protein
VAMFSEDLTTVDIFDVATGQVVHQYDVQGNLHVSASVQKNIAAMAVSAPQPGVHVINIKSGKLLSRFILPNGDNARVALSKDTITLAVGTDTGMSDCYS